VYLDEFSVAMANELDFEFQEDFELEAAMVAAIRIFTREMIFLHPEGKIDMAEFIEMCEWEANPDWGSIYVNGTSIADDILKVLEKNGIVKLKGDKIKWKKIDN